MQRTQSLWRIHQVPRMALVCGAASVGLPLLMAIVMSIRSGSDGLLGAFLVAIFFFVLSTALGSAVVFTIASALFAVITVSESAGFVLSSLVGAGLFAALVLLDLSISFRRAPAISSRYVMSVSTTTAAVILFGWAVFALAYALSQATTWSAIVVPLAILGTGAALRFAIEAHNRRTKATPTH